MLEQISYSSPIKTSTIKIGDLVTLRNGVIVEVISVKGTSFTSSSGGKYDIRKQLGVVQQILDKC